MNVHVTQAFTALLETFFDNGARSNEFSAGDFNQINQPFQGAAVCQKIVDEQNRIGGMDVGARHGDGVIEAVGIGNNLRTVQVVINIFRAEFPGKYDRNFEINAGHAGNADAGGFYRQDAGHIFIGKTAVKFPADLIVQFDINLLIKEAADIEDVAGHYPALGKYLVFQYLHISTNVPAARGNFFAELSAHTGCKLPGRATRI